MRIVPRWPAYLTYDNCRIAGGQAARIRVDLELKARPASQTPPGKETGMIRRFSTLWIRGTQSIFPTIALLAATFSGVAALVAEPAHAACTKSWAAAADGFWSVSGNW